VACKSKLGHFGNNTDRLLFAFELSKGCSVGITGSTVCTAIVLPLKNPDWFRSLIVFYREKTLPWPHISVLSTLILRKIHETYTPEEMREVELDMQIIPSVRPKARPGRMLNRGVEKLGGPPKSSYND